MLYFKDYITKLEKSNGLYYIITYGKKNYEGSKRTKMVAGSTSSDYWKIEGTKATRVHLKERIFKFTPGTKNTCQGNGKTTDPWLFRLGGNRVTKVKFLTTPDEEHVISEDWRHSTTSNELPENGKEKLFSTASRTIR